VIHKIKTADDLKTFRWICQVSEVNFDSGFNTDSQFRPAGSSNSPAKDVNDLYIAPSATKRLTRELR
jgi:hypothetical protein